jgi:hypothetical protein
VVVGISEKITLLTIVPLIFFKDQVKNIQPVSFAQNILREVLLCQKGDGTFKALPVKDFTKKLISCPTGFPIYYFTWFIRLKSQKKGILSFI